MKHKVKVTVIDKKLYPELQQQYCADPCSGMCPCYNVGDEFIFERDDQPDNFYHSVIRCMLAKGFSEEEVEKIVSGNFLRVFGEATK